MHIIAAQTAREDLRTSEIGPASRSHYAHFLIAPRPNLFSPRTTGGRGRRGRRARRKKKKKKRTGASAFIDDMAEEEDADDDDDEDEEGEEEDLDEGEREAVELEAQAAHPREVPEHGEHGAHGERGRAREADQGEVCSAHGEEFDGDVVGSVVDQQALHPTVRDPKLWLVTVKQGKERETVVCLMQKAINLHKSGKGSMAIKSACVQDPLKSYIYVEAERESDVKESSPGHEARLPLQAHQTGAHYRDGGLHHRHQEEGREHPVPIMGEDARRRLQG